MPENLENRTNSQEWVIAQVMDHSTAIAALVEGQKQLSKSLTENTDRILDVVERFDKDFNAKFREVQTTVVEARNKAYETNVAAGKVNYPAIGVAFAIGTAVLGYYVNSQIGDLRATVNANQTALRDMDKAHDADHDTMIRNDERMNLLLKGVIKIPVTP